MRRFRDGNDREEDEEEDVVVAEARGVPRGVLASLGEGGEASEELDGVAVAARAELVFGGIVFGLRATRDDAKAVVRGSGREGPRVVMQRAKIAPSLGGGVPGQGKGR